MMADSGAAGAKYPKPAPPAAPLTPEFEGYVYGTYFGWSVVRQRDTQRWCVRTPAGAVVATSARWWAAINHALEQRG